MMKEEIKNQNTETTEDAQELDFDALDQVSGGSALRSAQKVKPTEISKSTISKS